MAKREGADGEEGGRKGAEGGNGNHVLFDRPVKKKQVLSLKKRGGKGRIRESTKGGPGDQRREKKGKEVLQHRKIGPYCSSANRKRVKKKKEKIQGKVIRTGGEKEKEGKKE